MSWMEISLNSPVLKGRLIELSRKKSHGTFIKCTGIWSNMMTDGYSSHELRRRSLSYSGWYIDVYLCYMRNEEKMLLRAAVDVSTRIQDAAVSSVSVPGPHRSSISYDVQINAIYRHPTIISATNRERYFRLKKDTFVLIKRQRFIERNAVATYR